MDSATFFKRGSEAARTEMNLVFDFQQAADRRRFYLERGMRRVPVGAGSDLKALMDAPRKEAAVHPKDLFGDIPAVVIGGVATALYAPERHTKDIDFLIEHRRFSDATKNLTRAGFRRERKLLFPNASLGLYGDAWSHNEIHVDILASSGEWAQRALRKPNLDPRGVPVVSLPYLALMKFDSARGVDQGDLTRMLGRVDDAAVEALIAEVAEFSGDPAFADHIRQYVKLGRGELGLEP